MVKIKGPMMSLDASGTLGDAVTFSKWKGRSYVRERVIPSNPKSGAQVGRRAMFIFLTKAWNALSDANKATWQELADQLVASPFSAYVSYNMEAWHNFLAPSKVTPATRAANASDNAILLAEQEQNRVKITIEGLSLNSAWGIAIFHSATGSFTPSVGNCILCETDTTPTTHTYFWTPPTTTLGFFNSIAFSIDGKKAAAGGEFPPPP